MSAQQINLVPCGADAVQNFNAMGTSTTGALPAGWRILGNTSSSVGWTNGAATTNLTAQASSGTNTTGRTNNFGHTGGANRAPGVMGASGFAGPSHLMARYVNSGATNITSVVVDFNGKQFRRNTSAASIELYWSTSGAAGSWTQITVSTINFTTGTASHTFDWPETIAATSATISTTIAPSGSLYLRWALITAGANYQGIALDDVTIKLAPAAVTASPTEVYVCENASANLTASGGTLAYVVSGQNATSAAIPAHSSGGGPAGLARTVSISGVPAGAVITGVSIFFNIAHANTDELDINLSAPNGNTLNMRDGDGSGGGDDFINTVVSNAGSTAISSASAPFSNLYAPQASIGVGSTSYSSNAAGFANLYSGINGTWTLSMRDTGGGTTGTFGSWSIAISYSVPTTLSWSPATYLNTATGPSVTTTPGANSTYTVSAAGLGCAASASVNVIVAYPLPVAITPASASMCFGDDAVMLNVTDGLPTTNVNVASGAISVNIPQSPNATGANHVLNMTGVPACATVTGISVNFNLPTTSVDDYIINLTAPNGNTINLVNQPGGMTYLDNFTNTTISSTATALLSSSTAPYTGTFAADLGAGIGPTAFTSNSTEWCNLMTTGNGNWTISARDMIALDLGSFTSWTLTLTYVTSSYVWSPATGLSLTTGACTHAAPATTTNYVVTATSQHGCVSVSNPVTLTVNRVLGVLSGTATLCSGQSTDLTITTTGAGPFTGTLMPGSIPFSGAGPSIVVSITPGAAATYTLGTLVGLFCEALPADLAGSAIISINGAPTALSIAPATAEICLGGSVALTASGGTVSSNASNTTGAINLSIPNNSATGITSTLVIAGIPGSAAVTGIAVTANVTHPNVGDLILNLRAPNGNVLNLVNREGGSGDNFASTVFSSEGVTSIVGEAAPFTATYSTESSIGVGATGQSSNVAAFSNLMSVGNGNWVFSARDASNPNSGNITSWSIVITYSVPQPITWLPVTGLNIATGAAVIASPASTTNYIATATGANGCTSSVSREVLVRRITAAITGGTTSLCGSGSSTITLFVTGTGTLSGTLSPGGIAFSGTAPQISVNVTPNSTLTYEIATLNDGTCNADVADLTGSATVTVIVPTTYYADADGDGYGTNATTTTNCTGAPNGYSALGGDCDDANSDSNPGADEWLNGLDDNCDGNIDEGLVGITFYRDADSDGYGNAANTIIAWLIAPPGYVSNNTDCNDALAGVHPAATEVCGNGIDDDCDGTVDEGCGPINDERDTALILFTRPLGQCFTATGTLTGANVSPESGASCTTGEDVWYYFTAPMPGLRIACTTAAANVLLELRDDMGNVIDVENVRPGVGNESLNTGTLTPGATYFLRVRNFNSAQGSGAFTLCLNHLKESYCESGAGPYSLCQTVKSRFVSAQSYTFHFTPTGGGATISQTVNGGITVLTLANVPGLAYSRSYNVKVDAIYATTDGLGNADPLIIPSVITVAITTGPHFTPVLRLIDQCPASVTPNAIIGATKWVCGATAYEYEFTPVAPVSGAPFVRSNNAPNRFINLYGSGVLPGYTYNVRIRPVFGMTPGTWGGTYDCIRIATLLSGEMDEEHVAWNAAPALTSGMPVNELEVSIYPNPNSGSDWTLVLPMFDTTQKATVVLTDGMGREVIRTQVNSGGPIAMHSEQLAAGVYQVEVRIGENRSMQRMIVH